MKKAAVMILLMALLLSACSTPVDAPPVETVEPTEIANPTSIPSPTPMEIPPVVLTVCTANLPDSLFPYAGVNTAAKTRALDLLYPPGLTDDEGTLKSLTLANVPAQSDGDIRLEPVSVRRGQTVVDARGELVTAAEGVWLRPSGCRAADCAVTWNGLDLLEMDQMVIVFQLRDDLTWSDGTPVSAADSVFSYQLANDSASPAYGWAEAHTQDYSTVDEGTVRWRGYPGFGSSDLARFFWLPLPAHVFDSGADFETIAADLSWTSAPQTYGPFAVDAWTADGLRLVRVPAHPLADQILPGIDQVVLRAVEGGAAAAWDALQAGTCDVLDASLRLADEPELLAAIEAQDGFELRVRGGDSWAQLVFGMRPAEYDAMSNPIFAARPDYFADPRTRQGIAHCLDRDALRDVTRSHPWTSFLPPEKSQLTETSAYDPQAGIDLLAVVGWRDHDGDPSTPRVAQDVLTVFNGIPLSLALLVGPSPFHQDLAAVIAESLTACGVGIEVRTLPPTELYAPGPEGPLFGRQFDLALIAWQPLPGPDCSLYTSWTVPAAGNEWIGTNIAGFSDPAYDAACAAAALALPEEADALLAAAEAAFMELLPAVPLVAPPVVEIAR